MSDLTRRREGGREGDTHLYVVEISREAVDEEVRGPGATPGCHLGSEEGKGNADGHDFSWREGGREVEKGGGLGGGRAGGHTKLVPCSRQPSIS